jgi:hypothetical protein
MNTQSKIIRWLLCLFLIAGWFGTRPANSVQALPSGSQFGYTYTLLDPVWEAEDSPTYLTDFENQTSAQIPLGFEFKFYEKNYTDIYINANGFITFQPLDAGYNYNKPIPLDELPNAMIAPFWSDLVVSSAYPIGDGGKIYYKLIGAAPPNRKFVITWYNASRLAGTETMSFQVVLYELDGSIDINYASMISTPNPATIGIKDSDGVDGTQLLFNGVAAAGFNIAQKKSIHFAYPSPGFRLKALPPFNSGFFTNGSLILPITVVNTSDLYSGTDSYDLSTQKQNHTSDSTWSVSIQDAGGLPITNTGAVPSGSSKTVYARLTAPTTAPVGDYLRLNLTFTSTKVSQPKTTVTLQGAVPSPFIQGYALDYVNTGTYLQVATALKGFARTVNPGRLGRDVYQSLAITPTTNPLQYVTAWTYNNAGDSYNIQYSLVNLFSTTASAIKTLITNPANYYDQFPTLAVASNGVTGIAFIQDYKPDSTNVQQNVFFARLDPAGNVIATPSGGTQVGFNITGNTQAGTHGQDGQPFFSSVRIIATANNHFLVVWVKEEASGDHIYQDIGFAAFDALTGQMKCGLATCPRYITASTLSTNYFAPALSIESGSSNALLTYLSNATTAPNFFGRLLTETGPVMGGVGLGKINAGELDVVQLVGGNLLAAWVEPLTAQVRYGIWSKGGDVIKAETGLAAPDSHNAYKVSVTYDSSGNGLITWSNQGNSRLYYSLVNNSGASLTPPMIQINAAVGAKMTMGSGIFATAPFRDVTKWFYVPVINK